MTMSAAPKGCTPAYNGCQCPCHRTPHMFHLVPCCTPTWAQVPPPPTVDAATLQAVLDGELPPLKRYGVTGSLGASHPHLANYVLVEETVDGIWVMYVDYALLKKERDALRVPVTSPPAPAKNVYEHTHTIDTTFMTKDSLIALCQNQSDLVQVARTERDAARADFKLALAERDDAVAKLNDALKANQGIISSLAGGAGDGMFLDLQGPTVGVAPKNYTVDILGKELHDTIVERNSIRGLLTRLEEQELPAIKAERDDLLRRVDNYKRTVTEASTALSAAGASELMDRDDRRDKFRAMEERARDRDVLGKAYNDTQDLLTAARNNLAITTAASKNLSRELTQVKVERDAALQELPAVRRAGEEALRERDEARVEHAALRVALHGYADEAGVGSCNPDGDVYGPEERVGLLVRDYRDARDGRDEARELCRSAKADVTTLRGLCKDLEKEREEWKLKGQNNDEYYRHFQRACEERDSLLAERDLARGALNEVRAMHSALCKALELENWSVLDALQSPNASVSGTWLAMTRLQQVQALVGDRDNWRTIAIASGYRSDGISAQRHTPGYVAEAHSQATLNHEEARELAEHKRGDSNLARCYLDLSARFLQLEAHWAPLKGSASEGALPKPGQGAFGTTAYPLTALDVAAEQDKYRHQLANEVIDKHLARTGTGYPELLLAIAAHLHLAAIGCDHAAQRAHELSAALGKWCMHRWGIETMGPAMDKLTEVVTAWCVAGEGKRGRPVEPKPLTFPPGTTESSDLKQYENSSTYAGPDGEPSHTLFKDTLEAAAKARAKRMAAWGGCWHAQRAWAGWED
jgi:hypothetical protein